MTDIKPKLADGSRWEGNAILDDTDCILSVGEHNNRTFVDIINKDSGEEIAVWLTDALAVIRAAGLDAVWDAAVRLLNHWERLDQGNRGLAAHHDTAILIDAIAHAVEAAGVKEPRDA